MSPLELREEREEKLKEYKALKAMFGNLLLENRGVLLTEGRGKPTENDIDYFTRKFKEAQQTLRR